MSEFEPVSVIGIRSELAGDPDEGWWYLEDLELAEIEAAILARINHLMEPLAYKSRQKKVKEGPSSLQASKPTPSPRRSRARQSSWHYDRGQRGGVIPQEGGWRVLQRDAELKERPE